MLACWHKIQLKPSKLFEKLRHIIVQRHLGGLSLKWVVWFHISPRQWADEDIWNQARIQISSTQQGETDIWNQARIFWFHISSRPQVNEDIWHLAPSFPWTMQTVLWVQLTSGETQIDLFWDPARNFCPEPFVLSALIMLPKHQDNSDSGQN